MECLSSYPGSLGKISSAVEANSPQPRVTDSNSKNAVNFSSARTTKRLPLPRCASPTKIVRPRESTAETQPQLQPALLRLSAIISQYFTRTIVPLLICGRRAQNSASQMPNNSVQLSLDGKPTTPSSFETTLRHNSRWNCNPASRSRGCG